MNDTFLPGSGFDTYESQDKVLMQMDGSTEAAVAVRILQQQGFAVVGAVVRLAPEQAEAAQRAKKAAETLGIECILPLLLSGISSDQISIRPENSNRGGVTIVTEFLGFSPTCPNIPP